VPRLRLVCRADSQARLMEKPGDDSAIWNFRVLADDGEIEITIGDDVRVADGIPNHVGLVIQVDRDGADIATAVAAAQLDAEVALMMLSAVTRAPTGAAEPLVAYEVTDGVERRAFQQWFRLPVMTGKVPASEQAFGELMPAYLAPSDQKLLWRLTQSMSWHRLALRAADSLMRFMQLWIACEALEPRLVELLAPPSPSGDQPPPFPGLQALATALGDPDNTVKRSYTLRNDLFHARRVTVPDMRTGADALVPFLENLLPAAWGRLLGIVDLGQKVAATATTAHPVTAIVHGILIEPDASRWRWANHPHLEGELTARREQTEDSRDVSITYDNNLHHVNVDNYEAGGLEIRGPSGANVGSWTFGGARVIRADGTQEEIAPAE